MFLNWQDRIFALADKKLQDPLTNWRTSDKLVSNDIPHPLVTQEEIRFHNIPCLIPHTAVSESTINYKYRDVNIGDMYIAKTLDNLESENIPTNNKSLQDVKRQELQIQNMIRL